MGGPMGPEGQITPGEAAKIRGVSRQRINVLINVGQLTVVDTVGPQKIRLLERTQVEQFKKERDKHAKRRTGRATTRQDSRSAR